MSTIAIIGAGFSGSLLAVHLLKRCNKDDRILLIEKNAQLGRGIAYSTGNPDHLLNVRAGNMSAFSDQPTHFVDWLKNLPEASRAGLDADIGPASFVSRSLYGAYIQSVMGDRLWHEGRDRNLFIATDEAVRLTRESGKLSIELAVGRRFPVDYAVLALGNFPPGRSSGDYHRDPWRPEALDGLDPEAHVLLIGTGLTMVDVVISLLRRGHKGAITAISRRGLLPRVHKSGYAPIKIERLSKPTSLAAITGEVRRLARQAEGNGGDWRAAIDGLRPITQRIWQDLPHAERARFLRHLRPWWDVHRHRMAPQVWDQLSRAIDQGQLRIQRAKLGEIRQEADGSIVQILTKGAPAELKVARIIDCSGLNSDFANQAQPMIRDLLARGEIRASSFGLGLDVTDDGAVIDKSGVAASDIYAVGPITRGKFWEIVAVPDLRIACERLAGHLQDVGIVGRDAEADALQRLALVSGG